MDSQQLRPRAQRKLWFNLSRRKMELEAIENKSNFVGIMQNQPVIALAIGDQSLLHPSSEMQNPVRITAFVRTCTTKESPCYGLQPGLDYHCCQEGTRLDY